LSPSTACATGASAIAESVNLIRLDEADIMIAGGIEEVLNPTIIHACKKMKAMGTMDDKYTNADQVSRPFDRDRSGFVLGEGAGILIIEVLLIFSNFS
jgi:3-oxoacyl-[acyl-carrier-protein] synthase II